MTVPALNFTSPEGQNAYLAAYNQVLSRWPVPCESHYVETKTGITHLVTAGPVDAPPLILLHAFGFSSSEWYPNIAALAKDHRVYAVDMMGDVNLSAPVKGFRSRPEMAEWLCELMDLLGIGKAAMVGHSYGGWLTVNMALCHPERLTKIALLAPASTFVPMVTQFYVRLMLLAFNRSVGMARNFARWVIVKPQDVPEDLVLVFATGMQKYHFKPILKPDVYTDEELQRITTPTLLMIGEHEVIYKAEKAMARATKLVKNLRTVLIKNASHGLNIEQPEAVNQALCAFLAG